MLVLRRKIDESIVVDGKITVKILSIDRDSVKIGISAPPQITVNRSEIEDRRVRHMAEKEASRNFPA